jgi:hypothetical protein
MKSFAIFAVAMFSLTLTSNAQESRTADYYLNAPERYLDKQIALNCACVTRKSEPLKNSKGIIFSAYTMSNRESSSATSYITVLVPEDKAESFARRYGSDLKYSSASYSAKVLPLVGIFKKAGDSDSPIYYLEVKQ